jgi:uncharacterized protein (DUF58 family)
MDKKLKKILIKTKKGVFSQFVGNNSSKFQGEGYDFVELREYEDGEDIRKIDWVISAKMQKPYVKVFHTQRQLNINIVSFLGGSLHFGLKRLKSELLVEISAILGYASIAQGDNFMSYIGNENLGINTKRSKKFFSVEVMARKLMEYELLNKTVDYKLMVDKLYKEIKQRSIIFLIGDFISEDSIDLKLLSKKHEVIVIIVRDRFEENPVAFGNVNLTDPSSGKTFEGDFSKSLIDKYKKNIELIDHKLYASLKKSNINFVKIYTDENPIVKLMKLFK